ncbi:MAG: type I-C CRISPR-associated protein Cas7/Csd2 [Rhodobacterales bacterium CG18_big_fil_WC_8_21_14_2_50_71_9]|nr:MAG: type I-C CRISPR-associated protein Cas7/Csd2 [Rhodobacterales bacterium CG18_big_fil_WC_8_21_14_2_50_71_9]
MTEADIGGRREFVLFFDVERGNPNGDPDAGNMPRMDPETGHGLVTDVCLKRKVRNYVEMKSLEEPEVLNKLKDGDKGFHIYVTEGAVLNEKHRQGFAAVRPGDPKVAKDKKLNPTSDAEAREVTKFMCMNFFDVRTFGAVMSTGINAGQVRGPVQVAFARSVEPVLPLEISITRMAATNEAELDTRKSADEQKRGDLRTMGRKHVIPYGLYRAEIFVSAHLAKKTGFGPDDLTLLTEALAGMFEHDRSAARGKMATRALIEFRHDNALGRAPAHKLFDRVTVKRMVGGAARKIDRRIDNAPPARAFTDYRIDIDRDAMPEGVEIVEHV